MSVNMQKAPIFPVCVFQISAAGSDGGRACVELRHAAETGGQHRTAETLPPAGAPPEGRQAQREAGEALRESSCGRENQTGGSGTQAFPQQRRRYFLL